MVCAGMEPWCLLVALMSLDVGGAITMKEPAEKKLHDHLLGERYSNLIRPTGNSSVKLTVKLGLRLSQLLEIDEKNQIMTTSVWLRQRLSLVLGMVRSQTEMGSPVLRGNHIPSESLWRPDIVLYNNADGAFEITLLTKATVYYTGRIVWEPPAIYKSYCPIDVEFFPFDMQECFMKFSSWTYDGFEIDLQHVCDSQAVFYEDTKVKIIDRGIDLKDFYQNVEWDVINVTARRMEKFYPCCPQPYPDIMFNITLRRRTLFYSLNLIMPCLTISCLTVLVFYLPSDSGEKITLSISILLALTVFFLLLSDISPPTSFVIPLISKYLLFTMIVVTLSIFLAVYTLGIHFRRPSTHKMSPWVKRVFTEILPKILLMKRPDLNWKSSDNKYRAVNGIEMQDVPDNHDITTRVGWSAGSTEGLRGRVPSRDSIEIKKYPREVIEAIERVKFVADHLRDADADNMEERDWKYVAMVMDRLFLYIFTTACVCGTLSIFLYAPSLYDPRGPLSLDDQLNCTY